jgi:hypothetical protein
LLPIAQRPNRDLIASREFFLRQAERAAQGLGTWHVAPGVKGGRMDNIFIERLWRSPKYGEST